jgi:hypothetical protein
VQFHARLDRQLACGRRQRADLALDALGLSSLRPVHLSTSARQPAEIAIRPLSAITDALGRVPADRA